MVPFWGPHGSRILRERLCAKSYLSSKTFQHRRARARALEKNHDGKTHSFLMTPPGKASSANPAVFPWPVSGNTSGAQRVTPTGANKTEVDHDHAHTATTALKQRRDAAEAPQHATQRSGVGRTGSSFYRNGSSRWHAPTPRSGIFEQHAARSVEASWGRHGAHAHRTRGR